MRRLFTSARWWHRPLVVETGRWVVTLASCVLIGWLAAQGI